MKKLFDIFDNIKYAILRNLRKFRNKKAKKHYDPFIY